MSEQRGRITRPWVLTTAALLTVAGATAVGVGLHAQRHAPQPAPAAAQPLPARTSEVPEPAAESGTATEKKTLSLDAAKPTDLSIPSIGVHSRLLSLGRAADESIEVPPQTRKAQAGWYRYSPTPGQVGPAVVLGHVDSAKYGPGVFFKLGALKRGAAVDVRRTDGTVAVFTVDKVESYPKDTFPTLAAYGNTDRAELRLITCGGDFDSGAHSYKNNIVVYASLTSSHR